MKLKNGAIGIGVVLVIIATVLVFLLPASTNLYISYVCCLIGIAMMIISAIRFDKRDVPGSFAQLMQAAWYLPASLVVSIAVLLIQKIIAVPVLVHIIIQLLLIAISAIKLIGVNAGKDYIREQDKKISEKTSHISDLITEVDKLTAKLSAFSEDERSAVQKAIRSLKEAIRYSDPMSNASVAEMDQQISEKVYALQTTCSAHDFIESCEGICADIRHRNNILKSSKS